MSDVILFGGTFDPPTIAHVEVAKRSMDAISASGVVFAPAFQSPLKNKPLTNPLHRLNMLKHALNDDSWASISLIELEREGVSYTIDTVESLVSEGMCVRLLIGADQWSQFDKWHRYEALLELANPIVIPRDGIDVPANRLLKIERIDCSSTKARLAIQAGDDITSMLHPSVAAYIAEHGLYR